MAVQGRRQMGCCEWMQWSRWIVLLQDEVHQGGRTARLHASAKNPKDGDFRMHSQPYRRKDPHQTNPVHEGLIQRNERCLR